jgi:hypothetical protein
MRMFTRKQAMSMAALPVSQFFRLSDDGVRCDRNGLFVGDAPMLERAPKSGGGYAWTLRRADEQDRDLGACYGFPVDVAAKRDRLAGVARALERGDLALAQISALLLRFPDPPSLAKGRLARGSAELARQLFASGLLKANWDSSQHPRTGEPPNPGWFAPKDDAPVQVAENDEGPRPTMTDAPPAPDGFAPILNEHKPLVPKEVEVEPPPGGEPEPEPTPPGASETEPAKPSRSPRELMRALRGLLKEEAFPIVQAGAVVDWAADKLSKLITDAVAELQGLTATSPAAVDQAVQRALEEALAAQDPPKTLAELQTRPTQNVGGYDDHHMVQQNTSNVEKSPVEIPVEKFGWNRINAPSNRVWIPRVQHRLITDYYNMTDPDDPSGRRRREVVSDLDYDAQYADALATLRKFGVLK